MGLTKKKHWLEIDVGTNPDKDTFLYMGRGFVWLQCECGHWVKININDKDVVVSAKYQTEQIAVKEE